MLSPVFVFSTKSTLPHNLTPLHAGLVISRKYFINLIHVDQYALQLSQRIFTFSDLRISILQDLFKRPASYFFHRKTGSQNFFFSDSTTVQGF
jgi:hypothetical protein